MFVCVVSSVQVRKWRPREKKTQKYMVLGSGPGFKPRGLTLDRKLPTCHHPTSGPVGHVKSDANRLEIFGLKVRIETWAPERNAGLGSP